MFESREHIAVGECKQRADNSKHLELAPGNDSGAERTLWETYLPKHIQSKGAFFVKDKMGCLRARGEYMM